MPAAPKRLAATRAAENILHQYTMPFAPRSPKRLGSTATRYEKDDKAFKPGGSTYRSLGDPDQKPMVGDAEADGRAGTSRQPIGVAWVAGATKIKSERTGTGKKGKGNVAVRGWGFPSRPGGGGAGDGEKEVGPAALLAANALVDRNASAREPSSKKRKDAATSTGKAAAGSHKRKRPASTSTPSTKLPPKSSPTHYKQSRWTRDSSPLTPRSSDQSDADHEQDARPLVPAQPSLQYYRPAPEPSPPASSMRWWSEIFPQPLSSPLSEYRWLPPRDTLLDDLPATQGKVHRATEDSAGSLSSMRWSPRSVSSARSTDGLQDQQAPTSKAMPPPVPSTTGAKTFKPRSQAFYRFHASPEIAPGAGSRAKRSNEVVMEIRESWEQVQKAFGRMERAMVKLGDEAVAEIMNGRKM